MDLLDFIPRNLYIVSLALFILGLVFKQTPKISNWSIPYILGIFGILSCNILEGFSLTSTLHGVIVTGVPVYFHQLYKQCKGAIKEKSILKNINITNPQNTPNDDSDKKV